MLRVAVCEDNEKELLYIERVLSQIIFVNIDLDVFASGKELLKTLQEENEYEYDIFFLEIDLQDISGIEVARIIRRRDWRPLLVFLARDAKYMPDVYDYMTFNYLLKPIDEKRLKRIIYRAAEYFQENTGLFHYSYNKVSCYILCGNILYFLKKGRSAYIYTKTGTKKCNMTVSDILQSIRSRTFIKISRSCIVNMQHIEMAIGNEVYIDGEKLSIGSTHREEFRKEYENYLERK